MPEPAAAQGEIRFGRNPESAIAMAVLRLRVIGITVGKFVIVASLRVDLDFPGGAAIARRESRPARIEGMTTFIANPTDLWPDLGENTGFGLQLVNDTEHDLGPVVVGAFVDRACLLGAAVVTIAAVGAVPPHFENRAVICEQLGQLVAKVSNIFGLTVVRAVAV